MRNYKIEHIYYKDGITPKEDDYSIERTGRIVEIDFSDFQRCVGKNAWIHYLYDKNGNDLSFKFMRTSIVESLNWNVDKSTIVLTTENSIYIFKEDREDCE